VRISENTDEISIYQLLLKQNQHQLFDLIVIKNDLACALKKQSGLNNNNFVI